MTDITKPSVQAFLVCDQVIEDSLTKKKSLIGIFTHLQAVAFPFQHQQIGLYFCLTDAEGPYHFDIDLIYLNNEKLVCRATLPNIVIGDCLQISDFGINIPSLIFPGPGRYEFRLWMAGHLIAQKDFNVMQMPGLQCDADAEPSDNGTNFLGPSPIPPLALSVIELPHISGPCGDQVLQLKRDFMATPAPSGSSDFIRDIVAADRAAGKHGSRVVTRFPPEPNGYLHIGHAKSICLNFGIAKENPGGICHLRFDDTNPTTEDPEYVQAIQEDVRWLGFDWCGKTFYASNYFERLYSFAITLMKKGKAYVDSLTADQIREYRGTLTEPGRISPYRTRSVEENLDLFQRMRAGEFPDGAHVLRAKIDMTSPNINLRDPVLYRIRHAAHNRTGVTWCIYPAYDYAHPLSDAIEGITHSICTLEFEDHRPLYDWVVLETDAPHRPQQIEFARLNLTFAVLSKRKLLELVRKKLVAGWDDPRLTTIKGLRRRGVTPEAIRAFCKHIGVAKRDAIVEMQLLEHFLREDLNKRSPRVMAVLKPLKVVIDNYPEGTVEELDAVNNPEDQSAGTRKVPFSRTLYIEQDDFREDPPKQFFRLAPGREVRLRYAYIIKCVSTTKDPQTGEITELHCTYDPETKSGSSQEQRKVKATIHWVAASHAADAEVRLYNPLLITDPAKIPANYDWTLYLNPQSLERLNGCLVEPGLRAAQAGSRFQFERQGYFCVDSDSSARVLVFNRTVSLKDAWAKIEKAQQAC